MVQIDVTFLPSGPVRTAVTPTLTSAHSNDQVNWVFHSFDPAILSVQVQFKPNNKSYFFPRGQGNPHQSLQTDLVSGGAILWGRAPGLPADGSEASDYTIRAYATHSDDPHQNELPAYYLDPTVVTEQP